MDETAEENCTLGPCMAERAAGCDKYCRLHCSQVCKGAHGDKEAA